MAKVTLYQCDECRGIIESSDGGIVVRGNVYAAHIDEEHPEPIVGDNFPMRSTSIKNPLPKEPTHTFERAEVGETVLCNDCAKCVLGL